MQYRVGTELDWPAIVEFLQNTNYFLPVNPGDIGGRWFVAEHEGKIKATLWFFAAPPNAYLDYFATSSPMVAAKLLVQTEAVLKAHGIRFVRAGIPIDNIPMARLANYFGANIALGYTNAFKEIK